MWHKIYTFQKNIKNIKDFLSELASKESEIANGYEKVLEWGSYKVAEPLLEDFEASLLEIEDSLKYINKKMHAQLLDLKKKSNIVEELTTIAVELSILNKKSLRNRPGFFDNFSKISVSSLTIKINNNSINKPELQSISKTLISITHLSSLIKRLEKLFENMKKIDDEIFKPSNVDSDILSNYLNEAIESINENNFINTMHKVHLINYIKSAQTEIIQDETNWKKTVGVLVIVSALLSGMADAPDAYENVSKAIQYIMGSSIDKQILIPTPSLPHIQIDTKEDESEVVNA